MPAVPARVLVQAVLDAVSESGGSAVLVSPLGQQPRRFAVTTPNDESFILAVYIWTLTFGGRRNLANEHRIQMTSVQSPLLIEQNGTTVLLGYEPNLQIFAGFDIQRHRTFTAGSPSIQISIAALHRAETEGLTFHRKSNNEVAVGIRPDHLLTYAVNAASFHRYGSEAAVRRLLERAAAGTAIQASDVRALSTERRRLVQVTSRLSRVSSFRREVLFAYGHTCAVTRVQLRLVEAAHILPVGSPESADHVTNGIALSPTYHRAFDAGLIFLDEHYKMRLNESRVIEFTGLGLTRGLQGFRATLGRIFLPPARGQWPHRDFIRRANRYRRVT